MRMTLCRRGRSVLVLTLVFGLVTASIIPDSNLLTFCGYLHKNTISRPAVEPAVLRWLHCSGGTARSPGHRALSERIRSRCPEAGARRPSARRKLIGMERHSGSLGEI